MRATVVVELPPGLDQHLWFAQIAEPRPVQGLVAQLAVEALHEPVLPRLAGSPEVDAPPAGTTDGRGKENGARNFFLAP